MAAPVRTISLHGMFAAAARRTPDAIALIAGEQQTTYGELDQRANILAGRLRVLGVGPEISVAVRLGRSIDLVVAMLAVLKSGGVYLPVEPATPAHRCQLMLTTGAVRILVTRSDLHDPAVTGPLPDLVYTDTAGPGGGYHADTEVPSDALAYITFTSGSSGTPKAVGTTHGNATHYLRHLAETGYLTATDTTLQLAAPEFDASIRDILGPLIVGARIVLVPDHLARDADVLNDLLVRHTVSVMPALVPATLRLLCDATYPPGGARLRLLLVSGETLTIETARRAWDRFGNHVVIVNHYGPTECTMTSTFHTVGHDRVDPVPVGRPPVWGRVYVLDSALAPVQAGTLGEIYLGGAGITRGYLDQRELTAARFLPDPFGSPGARMYRTGDLGRLDENGILFFHGRVDAQLNVNGVRIEPAEVETTLRQHESVGDIAITALSGTRGGTVLIGYVAARPGRVTDAAELREFARARLPEALVPKAFIPLPRLPRTSRGKLDRASLAGLQARHRTADEQAPRTENEAVLLAISRDLLRRPDLGPLDDLFEAGADSVVVMSLLTRIGRAFGRAPALADLLREPTVEAAARMLPRQREDSPAPVASDTKRDRPSPDHMPLSFAQQRLWFFEQLLAGSPLNTIATGFRIDGVLDTDALAAATSDILAHHAALRSTFGVDREQPTYRLAEVPSTAPFDIVPVAGALDEQVNAVAREPMDIERGPLLRVTLFDGAGDGALLVRMHHLVADAGSVEILLNDLAAAYRARRAGHRPRLPSIGHTYADYVAWQRDWLTDERATRHLEFWRKELDGSPPLLQLPTDRPRPPVQRYRGAVHVRVVRPDLLAAVTALGRAQAATPFTVLLTAWAALLSRYSGQDELVIGVPITERSQPELDRVVGLFVNTLPVHVSLAGTPTFRALLAHVRGALFRAIAHRDYPFERLVEQLHPERSPAYGPVFQTLADIQRAPSPELPDARLSPMVVDTGIARFDLSLSFLRRDSELAGVYTFNTDLFEPDTIERMAHQYETLLTDALTDADCPVNALALLHQPQRQVLTASPGRPVTRHPNVPDGIARQVGLHPDRVALSHAGRQLTYGELDMASARIAGRLAARGIGPGALVAICAERSPALVAGLVGIHRVGAAYLPLDPTHPDDRLALLAGNARPDLVLAQQHLLGRLRPLAPVCSLSESGPATPWTRAQSSDLAYVIHTSGSTGEPKGVEVTHSGLAHVLGELAARIDARPDDTLVAITTVSFDIAALELFLPLLAGARVVVASSEVSGDPVRLAALLHAERATVLQATPTTWQLLSELAPSPHRLRIALCGGEPMPASLAVELHSLADAAFNVYGPTETTIWSTIAELNSTNCPISIGTPIGDTTVHILDDRLAPVPTGVAGEIYLGGPGVARGYRNQPGQTAARFLADPFATTPGARMYRTGDRGRQYPDGRLEFLGRLDRQIKLRGFRIEPAEVERAVLAYPSVRRAVVTARSDAGDRPQLVAYVVADRRIDTDLLRAHLGENLPQYLVPTVVVPMDALPLTPNGKIDIAQLPEPDPTRPQLSTEFRQPGTDTEQMLGEIWADVLGVERLGADDDFFDLGGHSLRAIQLMVRVNEAFGVDLELYVLFTERTLRRLAARVELELAIDRQ
jgi:amino acid adenylation domain-containing protein